MTDRPGPERAAATEIAKEDLDDVIGAAETLKREEDEKLSLDEVRAVGRELDLDPRHVDRAVETTLEKRAAEERALAATKQARKKALTIAGIAIAAVLAILGVVTYATASGLRTSLGDVEAKKAQMKNVLERQAGVEKRFADAPPSSERDAELLGAENRVRIERKRYDEAAAHYNADAGGPIAGLSTSLYGLPRRVPLSNEVTSW